MFDIAQHKLQDDPVEVYILCLYDMEIKYEHSLKYVLNMKVHKHTCYNYVLMKPV